MWSTCKQWDINITKQILCFLAFKTDKKTVSKFNDVDVHAFGVIPTLKELAAHPIVKFSFASNRAHMQFTFTAKPIWIVRIVRRGVRWFTGRSYIFAANGTRPVFDSGLHLSLASVGFRCQKVSFRARLRLFCDSFTAFNLQRIRSRSYKEMVPPSESIVGI